MTALGNFLMNIAPIAFGIAGYLLGCSVTSYQHRIARAEYDWYRAKTVEHESIEDIARRAV